MMTKGGWRSAMPQGAERGARLALQPLHRHVVHPPGDPGRGQHQHREGQEGRARRRANPPAPHHGLADRRGDQRAERAGGRDDAEHGAAQRRRHRHVPPRQAPGRSRCRPGRGRCRRPRPRSPSTTPRRPATGSAGPARTARHPASMTGRKPKRSARAPAKGCSRPQARFCTATAMVKSATPMPSSRTAAGMNSPRLCRSPIARLMTTETANRIGMAGLPRSALSPLAMPSTPGPAPACRLRDRS